MRHTKEEKGISSPVRDTGEAKEEVIGPRKKAMLALKVGGKAKEKEKEKTNVAKDMVAMVDISPTKVMRLSTTPAPTSEEKERRETRARKERKVKRGTESMVHPDMATPPLKELVERHRPHQGRLP